MPFPPGLRCCLPRIRKFVKAHNHSVCSRCDLLWKGISGRCCSESSESQARSSPLGSQPTTGHEHAASGSASAPRTLRIWATSERSNSPAPSPSPQHTHKQGLFHGGEQTRPGENVVQPQFLGTTNCVSPAKQQQNKVLLSTATDSRTRTNLPPGSQ